LFGSIWLRRIATGSPLILDSNGDRGDASALTGSYYRTQHFLVGVHHNKAGAGSLLCRRELRKRDIREGSYRYELNQ